MNDQVENDGQNEPADTIPWPGGLLRTLDRISWLRGGRAQAVFLGLFFLLALSSYLLVLKVRGPAAATSTQTEWDRQIPFVPWWIWVYLLPYVVGPVIAIILRRELFAWYIQQALIVMVLSLAIFVAWPTHTVRPPTTDLAPGPSVEMYHMTVSIDEPPANAAPSLHVSLSCLLAWALVFDRPRWWPATLAGAIVVWLSTLFTHQHHLVDVGTGILLASTVALVRRPATSS